jgi:hypothetical protein
MGAKNEGFGFALRKAIDISTAPFNRMNPYSQSGEDLLF